MDLEKIQNREPSLVLNEQMQKDYSWIMEVKEMEHLLTLRDEDVDVEAFDFSALDFIFDYNAHISDEKRKEVLHKLFYWMDEVFRFKDMFRYIDPDEEENQQDTSLSE